MGKETVPRKEYVDWAHINGNDVQQLSDPVFMTNVNHDLYKMYIEISKEKSATVIIFPSYSIDVDYLSPIEYQVPNKTTNGTQVGLSILKWPLIHTEVDFERSTGFSRIFRSSFKVDYADPYDQILPDRKIWPHPRRP